MQAAVVPDSSEPAPTGKKKDARAEAKAARVRFLEMYRPLAACQQIDKYSHNQIDNLKQKTMAIRCQYLIKSWLAVKQNKYTCLLILQQR